MRCPRCDALNPDTAAWCTQCFAVVGGPTVDPTAPMLEPTVGADERAGPDTAAPRIVPAGHDRQIRTKDGGVERRCARCGRWVDLMASTCPDCGAPRTGFELQPLRHPGVQPGAAVPATAALLPGAGHWILGQSASAVARGLLSTLWLVGGVLLLRQRSGSAPGLLLLGGAAALWVLSFVGARRLAAGGVDVIDTRRLTWLVIGVTGVLVAMMVLTGFGAVR